VVRGVLYLSGWYLKIDPNNPNRTLATFIGQVDLKGYLPKWAFNMGVAKVGFQVSDLWKTMDYFRDRGELHISKY
jgi:hypothetical protein